MKKRIKCEDCRKPFEYEWSGNGRLRSLCDRCRQAKERAAWAASRAKLKRERDKQGKWKDPPVHARAKAMSGLALRTQAEVGEIMGTTEANIQQIERRALLKIRNRPDSQEIFQLWKDEGVPVGEDGFGCRTRGTGEVLLEHQLQVSEWYQLHDVLSAMGLKGEAKECLEQIASCQKTIAQALERIC